MWTLKDPGQGNDLVVSVFKGAGAISDPPAPLMRTLQQAGCMLLC